MRSSLLWVQRFDLMVNGKKKNHFVFHSKSVWLRHQVDTQEYYIIGGFIFNS
jgi:hypothetical protein